MISMVLSRKRKAVELHGDKRGSETSVSCYEVQMGLVPRPSARCWGGDRGRSLVGPAGPLALWPGHGSLQAARCAVPLMQQAPPAAAVTPLAPTEFGVFAPFYASSPQTELSWVP